MFLVCFLHTFGSKVCEHENAVKSVLSEKGFFCFALEKRFNCAVHLYSSFYRAPWICYLGQMCRQNVQC